MKDILLVDDDQELCALLHKYFERENLLLTCVHDGPSGLQKAQKDDYKLVILDVMLPQMDGFTVLTELRKTSAVPVLMLTAKDSEVDKISGLRLGADDYLVKPFSAAELVARVQSLIRRYTIFNESTPDEHQILIFQQLVIDSNRRQVTMAGQELRLTAKEFDLLYFLASQPGRVFTKKQIYRAVWQDEYAFDDNNIMVHIGRLRKKVEPNPEQPSYVQTVWGVGYKFGGDQ